MGIVKLKTVKVKQRAVKRKKQLLCVKHHSHLKPLK